MNQTKQVLEGLAEFEKLNDESPDNWDLPAMMYLVGPPAPEGEKTPVIVVPIIDPIDIVDYIWSFGEAIQRKVIAVPNGMGITGLVLRTEGWALAGKEEIEKYQGVPRDIPISEHPDRVEIKSFIAVDADGITGISYERGKSDTPHDMSSAGMLSGRLIEALQFTYNALLTPAEGE